MGIYGDKRVGSVGECRHEPLFVHRELAQRNAVPCARNARRFVAAGLGRRPLVYRFVVLPVMSSKLMPMLFAFS